VLRYVGYKRFVFTGGDDASDEAALALAAQPVVPLDAVVAAEQSVAAHHAEDPLPR